MVINPIVDAFAEIAREKNIGREQLIGMIEAGLVAAVRRKYGAGCAVEVKIEPVSGGIDIRLGREVVEEVIDPTAQVSLAEARGEQDEIGLGEVLWHEVPFGEFGRNAIQAFDKIEGVPPIIVRNRHAAPHLFP